MSYPKPPVLTQKREPIPKFAEMDTEEIVNYTDKYEAAKDIVCRCEEVTRAELESFSGLKIPTLKEALELTEKLDLKVNLDLITLEVSEGDIKKRSEVIVNKVVSLVKEISLEEQVIISSFDHSIIELVKEKTPEIEGAILVKELKPEDTESLRVNQGDYYSISEKGLLGSEGGVKNLLCSVDLFAFQPVTISLQVMDFSLVDQSIDQRLGQGVVPQCPAPFVQTLAGSDDG